MLSVMHAGACGAAAPSSPATARPSEIVFAANHSVGHDGQIVRVDLGGRRTLLAPGISVRSDLMLSPNGSWVAFDGERAGASHVYVLHPDGTGLGRLTAGGSSLSLGEGDLVRSPNSRELAFANGGGDSPPVVSFSGPSASTGGPTWLDDERVLVGVSVRSSRAAGRRAPLEG